MIVENFYSPNFEKFKNAVRNIIKSPPTSSTTTNVSQPLSLTQIFFLFLIFLLLL